MTDIFISYSRGDRDTAHALADALEATGVDVWWDRELTGGGDFAAEIERHLDAARLVIVLWSISSVQSDFVRDESSRARDLRKLLPVRIEDIGLPLGFGTLHTLDLLDWDGDPDHRGLVDLLGQVRERLQAAGPAAGAGESPTDRPPRPNAESDPLSRRRSRRRWLLGLGAAGIAAGGGVAGWSIVADSRRQRSQAALAHLEKAFGHHFEADPPELMKAGLEYRLATDADPSLAEAFYHWGHLTIALMGRKQPKPSPRELAGLREDALERFGRSLQLAGLGRGQRAVAEEQIAWLGAAEPAPLARSTDPLQVAALTAAPPAAATRPPEPVAAARPGLAPNPIGGTKATGAPSTGTIASAAAPARAPSAPPTASPDGPARPAAAATAPVDPRRPAPPELARRAAAEAQALFAADRDSRLGAHSVLTGNPRLAADALPAALAAARASLSAPAADTAARAGLAATVRLVGASTPSVVQSNRAAIEALQQGLAASPDRAPADAASTLAAALQRAQRARPAVFLQIANPRQAPLARQLLQRLEAAGYASAEIEEVGAQRAPSQPEVRSHGGSDPSMARWCQQKLSELTGTTAVLRNLRGIRPDNDVFEIWFDAALCAPGGRQLAGCGEG